MSPRLITIAKRFVEFCDSNPLVQRILAPLEKKFETDVDAWWVGATDRRTKISFPSDQDEEFVLRYRVIRSARENDIRIFELGLVYGKHERDEAVEFFRTLVPPPVCRSSVPATWRRRRFGDAGGASCAGRSPQSYSAPSPSPNFSKPQVRRQATRLPLLPRSENPRLQSLA